jgi:hypothetical protein
MILLRAREAGPYMPNLLVVNALWLCIIISLLFKQTHPLCLENVPI